jgi:hypothetical protein
MKFKLKDKLTLNQRLIILTIIAIVLTSYNACYGQDKRFTFSGRTELADKNTHNDVFDYGFNIGAQIEYQMTILYFNAEAFYFPGLNNLDYLHFQGTVLGLNHHSRNEQWRYYIGILKPGFILRDGGPHALFGHDIGIEHYFNNQFFIGIESGLNTKGDSKVWSNDSSHTVWYISLTFGITL